MSEPSENPHELFTQELLSAHFPACAPGSCPSLLDVLAVLDQFGRWTLGSHPWTSAGAESQNEYVCAVRLGNGEFGTLPAGAGDSPLVAAARCLEAAVAALSAETETGIGDIQQFLDAQ